MKENISIFDLSLVMKKRTSRSLVKISQEEKGMTCAIAEFFQLVLKIGSKYLFISWHNWSPDICRNFWNFSPHLTWLQHWFSPNLFFMARLIISFYVSVIKTVESSSLWQQTKCCPFMAFFFPSPVSGQCKKFGEDTINPVCPPS